MPFVRTSGQEPSYQLGNVGVKVTADTKGSEDLLSDGGGFPTICYQMMQASGRLIFRPKLLFKGENGELEDYLGMIRGNRPIFPVSQVIPGTSNFFPELDVRIVNNSGRTLFFSKATINVAKSALNDEPLLLLFGGYDEVFYFTIVNDGWGSVDWMKLEFNLSTDRPEQIAETSDYAKEFGGFTDKVRVDLYDELLNAGVSRALVSLSKRYNELDLLSKEQDNEDRGYEVEKVQGNIARQIWTLPIENFGPFRNQGQHYADYKEDRVGATAGAGGAGMYAVASGKISYQWTDAARTAHLRKIPFWTEVLVSPPDGLGIPGPIVGEYDAMLKSVGDNYHVILPISNPVKSGDVTRFLIRIGMPRSSNHELQVRFETVDGGHVDSLPISIEGLLTKSAVKTLRSQEEDKNGNKVHTPE